MTVLADRRTSQFILFLLAGGISACGNFGSRFLFSRFVGYPQAIVMAYGVGILIAFLLMRGFVFGATGKALGPQLGKFVGVNLFGISQTLLISLGLVNTIFPALGVVENAEAYAHFLGLSVSAITSYFLHKRWSFR